MADQPSLFEVLVVGGGINGLCTLYHLHRLGCRRLGLIERFALGHDRGSSHGTSRVTRSAYSHSDYVRVMQRVHREEWPRLERDLGRTLIHPTPGCFFGPPCAEFDRYVQAVVEAGADAQILEPSQARRQFPLFRFEGAERVLLDRTAGVVAAARTISALAEFVRNAGICVREGTSVLGFDLAAHPIAVTTDQGILRTERLIVTAGSWASRLVPALAPCLTVVRQTVGYFRLAAPPEEQRVGRFPVWVYIGPGENEVFYGLPEFERPGVKFARHRTRGPADDPDRVPSDVPSIVLDDLAAFGRRQFAVPIEELVATEFCLYTNTPNEDFVIDHHPDDRRVVIGAGFSGHGFKFGPWTGRVLAELALEKQSPDPDWNLCRSRFAIRRD